MAVWWQKAALCPRCSPPPSRRRRGVWCSPGAVDEKISDPLQEQRVRLVFRDSKSTGVPLVARLAAEHGIMANVISASTQAISEEVYGSLLLGIPKGQLAEAREFLSSFPNIRYEEVDGNV